MAEHTLLRRGQGECTRLEAQRVADAVVVRTRPEPDWSVGPKDAVTARSVTPVQIAPRLSRGVVLVKAVVLAILVTRSVWVVHPARPVKTHTCMNCHHGCKILHVG